MDVINPATGEGEETYKEDTREDADAAFGWATSAFGEWRDRSIRDHGHLFDTAGDAAITTPSTPMPTSTLNHIRVHRDRRSKRCTNRSGPSSR